MPFTPSFSVSITTDPSSFTITDTSTGSDGSITTRQVFLNKADGTTLVPTGVATPYIPFPLSMGNTLNLTGILPNDMALDIQVVWIATSNYQTDSAYLFNTFSKQFEYNLIQQQASKPNIINDFNYWGNLSKFQTLLDNAEQAIAEASDIYNAQLNLDILLYMITNQSLFF
jgi:hypothetical protein